VLFAGSRGEEIDFDVRYFEVGAGKQTSFDRHEHAHVVIALRGRGSVRLGRRWLPLSRFDACYIGPYVAHRLRNDGRSPFGFLCLVDSVRDSSPLQVEGRWFACRSQAEK
jgi:mannose-6-phosphate isomerase-like protein (cupin superfamily)